MTRQDSTHIPPQDEEWPDWDAAPLDWRVLPIDEIMHERMIDHDHQDQR